MIVDERPGYREVLAINRAIAGAEAYDEVLRLVVERTAAFTGAAACMLLLSQEDGRARIVRSVGVDPARTAGVTVPLTERIDRELGGLLGFPSSDRFVGVPVIGKAGLLGILAVYWQGADTACDEELLSALADQVAIALDNADRVRRLRASEEKLATIIATAADAIISIDQAQRIVMFNEGAERIFGWSRGEVLGQPLDLLLPARSRATHRERVRAFGAAADPARRMVEHHTTVLGLRKNGEEFPVDAAISRLDDAGTWVFTAVLRDITEQKRIEHEQRFLADVGPVLADTLDFEETLARIADLAVREFADLCLVVIAGDDDELRRAKVTSRDPSKAGLCKVLARLPLDRRRPHLLRSVLETRRPMLLQSPSEETIASFAESEEHHRALRAAEIRSVMAAPLVAHGRLLGAIAFVSTTASRVFTPADVQMAEELAHRAALSIESARLYHVAQRATQARDDLLGIVAHDLRNPLNTIQLQANLLSRIAEREHRCDKRVAAIDRAVTRMDRLIEDLLDVTRMEAGRLSVEPSGVRVRQIIAESLEAQRPLSSTVALELRLEVDSDLPEVWADRDRLLQVFENLIGNALKFTEPGGLIAVGAAPRELDVLFWVRDTGSGIAAEDLPHLFDRFWQARKAGRRSAGLGLPIVKGIIEAHQGRIWVESTPGRGTTFFFSIPTRSGAAAQRHESAPTLP